MSTMCLDIDLHNVCRICLSQTDLSEHLFSIFSDAIVDGMLVSLSDVIEYCMVIQAQEFRDVPNKICQSCKTKMFEFYVFKQKCHRTNDVLRSMVEKSTYFEQFTDDIEDDECSHSLITHPTEPSESAFAVLLPIEPLPSATSVEEIHSDNDNLGKRPEHESHLDESNISISYDNVNGVNASSEEKYIEEIYDEIPFLSITEDQRSSVHDTIAQRSANDSFACGICGWVTASRARLKRHMKLHDDSNAVWSQMIFFSCVGCKTMYLNEEHLNEHSIICSNLSLTGDDRPPDRSSLDRIDASNGHCGICDASYTSIIQLKQHIITHMKKFPCPFGGCGCEYSSLTRLNIHVNSKHVDYISTTCPHCKEDIDRTDLNQHLRSSCKARHFQCSHCDKKFLSSRALSDHLRKLEQTFQCGTCAKSYSSRSTYKLHLRTHTGERPFVCRLCNKSYKTASLRTAHMESHIEGKTFQCTICGKFLQTSVCYRNHLKRHLEERNHGCNICGKKFYAKYSLRVHQETVHKIKRTVASDQIA